METLAGRLFDLSSAPAGTLRRRTRQDFALDLAALRIFGYLQVILGLEVHPQLSGRPEIARQAQGRVGGYPAFALQDGADTIRRHAQRQRQRIGGQFRIAEDILQYLARVYRG